MTRRRKIALIICTGCLAAPVAIWYAARRAQATKFLGAAGNVRFIYPDEVVARRPIIDVTLPSGTRLVYPLKGGIDLGDTDPATISGLLDWQNPTGKHYSPYDVFFRIKYPQDDEEWSLLPSFWNGPKGSRPRQGDLGPFDSTGCIWGIPYATAPAYQSATLVRNSFGVDEEWKVPIRLPVSDRFGPAQRETTTLVAGPWTITAKPRPWKLTTDPFVFDLNSGTASKPLLLQFRWRPAGRVPFESATSYLIETGETIVIRVEDELKGADFSATVVEAERVKLRLKAEVGKYGEVNLYRSDGLRLFSENAGENFKAAAIDMLACRGMRAEEGWSWRIEYGSNTFHRTKNGEVLEAFGYRKGREFVVSGKFDTGLSGVGSDR